MLTAHEQVIHSIFTEATMTFTMSRVCAVIFQGNIHFFGGESKRDSRNGIDYSQQHFGFDAKRNFVKYRELGMSSDIG